MASGNRVPKSMRVRMNRFPDGVRFRGPTMSIASRSNGSVMMGKGFRGGRLSGLLL